MKKIKIGLTAFALLAGIVSVFAARVSRFAGTAYWTDYLGNTIVQVSAPAECNNGSLFCANAYNSSGVKTGTVATRSN